MRSLVLFLVMATISGILYPFCMTGFCQLCFPYQANGSLLRLNQQIVGSECIGQKFSSGKYFWGRPSACGYKTLPSSGSNLSLASKKLVQQVQERVNDLVQVHGAIPPAALVYASASGLDPEIPLDAALYQLERIARARNLSPDRLHEIKMVIELKNRSSWRISPQPYLNVLNLNLTLDQLESNER